MNRKPISGSLLASRDGLFLAGFVLVAAVCALTVPVSAKSMAHPEPALWLRDYALSPYGEYWTLALKVSDLDGVLPKILDAINAENGVLTAPLSNFASSHAGKTQQLIFRLPKISGDGLVSKLGRLGGLDAPFKRPNEDLKYLPEIKSHLRQLKKERKTHAKFLAAMPGILEVATELLDRLTVIAAVYEKAGDTVLVDLTVQQNP